MIATTGSRPAKRCNLDQGAPLAHVGQAESTADQPATRKDILNLFRRGACSHVEILWNFTQQQIPNAATDYKSLETSFLQFAYYIGRVRAEVF